VAYPNFFLGGGGAGGITPGTFSRGSINSAEDRGQSVRGSGGGSPLVRGSTQFDYE
jgi:hypothetical protein